MSKEEEEFIEKLNRGLKESFYNLLKRKAALGQDMVFADEKGMPRIVPEREALVEYEARRARGEE